MKKTCEIWPNRSVVTLLAALTWLALPACKQGADASKTAEQPPEAAQESTAQARGVDVLVQQAASSCRQRIQQAAQEHAANGKLVQEAKVLAMKGVTQREQLEAKRELVRRFLAANEALKSLLVNEEAAFTEALAKLNVPQARIEAESRTFQSGIRDKALILRKRETDQHIGNALLGALDFLDELWGQWNYNKEYDQVQFSPPGALKKYNNFLEAIQAAFQEQKELQEQ
jgi:hypothetical protein